MKKTTKEILKHYKDSDLKKHGLTKAMAEKAIEEITFQSNDLFRYTFGSEDELSKMILAWMVSAFLEEEVIEVQLKNCEPAKGSFLERGNRLDVMCRIKDEKGFLRDVNIEIQNYGTTLENTERSQGYVAKQVVDILQEGEKRKVEEAVHIMLCNKMGMYDEEEEYWHQYSYREKIRNTELPGCMSRIIYLEMEKLEKLRKIPIEKWDRKQRIGFMIRYSQEEAMHDIIEVLIKEEQVLAMMEKKREEFFMNTAEALGAMKKHYDELEDKRQLEYAEKNGFELGKEQGIQLGKEQGKIEEKRAIIFQMHRMNLDIEFIAQCTQLSIEKISTIIKESNDQ